MRHQILRDIPNFQGIAVNDAVPI